jgi:predicted DCC family thiol-disulfide oxidoreductase YuxK
MQRTLIFDGACPFCTSAAQWALARARVPFAAVPYQAIAVDRYGLTVDQVRRSAWWVEENLQVDGHRAVAHVLMCCGGVWPLVGRAIRVPPLAWLAALGYAVVARIRGRLPGVRPAVHGAWDPFDGRPRRADPPQAHA